MSYITIFPHLSLGEQSLFFSNNTLDLIENLSFDFILKSLTVLLLSDHMDVIYWFKYTALPGQQTIRPSRGL